jgi:UDP-glucose 4-epimerase
MCGPVLNWFSDLIDLFDIQKMLDKLSKLFGCTALLKKKRYRHGSLLITGGLGFVGSHTAVEIFEDSGCMGFEKVILVDNLQNSSVSVLEKVKHLTGASEEELVFVNCDIRDTPQLSLIFQTYKPIVSVLHLVGSKPTSPISDPKAYYEDNMETSMSLIKVMQKFKCHDIVYASSKAVYGDRKKCEEDDLTNPTTPYGKMKVQFEKFLYELCNAD